MGKSNQEATKKRRRESEGDTLPKKKKKTEQEGTEKKTVNGNKNKMVKKPVAKKPVEKKPVAKKAVEKKAVEKKPVEKKPVEKKAVAKKAVAKKAVVKKPAEKKGGKKEKEEESEEEEEEEEGDEGVNIEDVNDDDDEEEYDDDDDDDDDDEEEDEGERLGMDPIKPSDMTEVNVDFEFFDLGEDDYHFVKRFLTSYIDGLPCTELADFLVKEESVGTAIRVDEACFGFISLVNLHHPRTKDLKGLKAMKDFVLRSVQGNKEKHAALADLLNNQTVSELFSASSSSSSSSSSSEKPTVSLIFNERVVNCPEQLALPLHENFWEEINYAVEHENEDENGSKSSGEGYFCSDYFIMVSKVSDDNPHVLQQRGKGQEKLGKKQIVDSSASSFLKLEDEIYAKHALMAYKCPLKKGESKIIVLFERSQIPTIIADLKKTCMEG